MHVESKKKTVIMTVITDSDLLQLEQNSILNILKCLVLQNRVTFYQSLISFMMSIKTKTLDVQWWKIVSDELSNFALSGNYFYFSNLGIFRNKIKDVSRSNLRFTVE